MMWKLCHRNPRSRGEGRKERGQAVVEFALVMVLFLMFLLAVVDLGRAYFTVVALENAASEGALYGMANPNCKTTAEGAANCGGSENSIQYRVEYESANAMMDPALVQFTVTLEDPVTMAPGTRIEVTVTYPFRPILPLLSAFGAGTIMLNSTAIQLIP